MLERFVLLTLVILMRKLAPLTDGPRYLVVWRLLLDVEKMLLHTPPVATCNSNA